MPVGRFSSPAFLNHHTRLYEYYYNFHTINT
jgi:hypothetical protein